ncbi:hypothetical protein COOONC_10448 [Cooperia oncophora]
MRLSRPPHNYKCVMTFKADQFRSMNFIYCRKKAKEKEMSPLPLERTPFCCWKIREERGDVDWFVEVDDMQMEVFAAYLVKVLTRRVENIESRLQLNRKMTFSEIPLECQASMKKDLHERGYSTEQEYEAKSSKFSNLVSHTFRWGAVSEVFTARSTVVRTMKQQTGQLELQGNRDVSTPLGFAY